MLMSSEILEKVLNQFKQNNDHHSLISVLKTNNQYHLTLNFNNQDHIHLDQLEHIFFFDLRKICHKGMVIINVKSSKNISLICHICNEQYIETSSRIIPASTNYVFKLNDSDSFCYFTFKITKADDSWLEFISFDFYDFKSTFIKRISDTCTLRFVIKNLENRKKGVIIFFPSAFNEKNYFPEYTRWSWMDEFKQYCTICVANPFSTHPWHNPCNSWFLDSTGESVLPLLCSELTKILGTSHGKILTCGSSMGGYGAILGAYYLNAHYCIAECPQSNLLSYRVSNDFIKTLPKLPKEEFLDIFTFMSARDINYKIKVFFNVGDIYHISSFFEHFNQETKQTLKKLDININIYRELDKNELNFGHLTLTKQTALRVIKNILSDFYDSNI